MSGKTFDVKDHLKAKGARWDAKVSGWIFRDRTNVEELREELREVVEAAEFRRKQELAEQKLRRKWLRTPEGREYAAAEEKKRVAEAVAAGCGWICCEECEVVSWERKTTSCAVHAVDGNTFRVRGCIYTGD